MFYPKFTISSKILTSIGHIEAARAVINRAPLIPSYEKSFQEDAVLRTVHFGTRIEGNELSLSQAARVMAGEDILAGKRDVQEVINYRNVINLIEGLIQEKKVNKKTIVYQEKDLKKIHLLVTKRILSEEKSGQYRKTQVIVRSLSGAVVFRAPPAIEVPYLITSFFKFLNSGQGQQLHPVLRAGVAHYILVAIHPFVEGNGRSSRAFANLILFAEGYDIRRLFSLEEFFDKNLGDYYGVLKKTSDQSRDLEKRDLTDWLEFFSQALAIELDRVKEEIERLSVDGRLRKRLGGKQISLSSRQVKLMEYINSHGGINMAAARSILSMVSEDTILRELQDLRDKKVVRKVGKTKGAKYILR
ncbi:MAG: Fic family protein [Candidatus Shapirobacteria bacterium]|nr:Fic family protein [Candidatus Shapirobacteria bacterium]